MPRGTDIRKPGFIPIPQNLDKMAHKVEIITDAGTFDVTADILPLSGTIEKLATEGLSSFSFLIDNTEGKHKGKFAGGDSVNIYYDNKPEDELTTIRMRGLIDNVFDEVTQSNGWILIVEGRDSPKSSTNEHFGDTDITLQFIGRNNLDCWFGTTGTIDDEENFPDGVLYNSGMIMQVFDTADDTWKNYKDLSSGQKDTLKAQTGYTQTNTSTNVDKKRIDISKTLATEGDYEFYIYFNPGDSKFYFRIHPEEAVINTVESVVSGQNFIGLTRYGTDTLEEVNRFKELGFTDSNILLFRTKQDTDRQSNLWIKDKTETTSELTNDVEVSAKALARLNELKNGLGKGGLDCCILPSLQPGERIRLIISYIINAYIKVKSFTITFGQDISFNLQIQDRETTFGRIFKDRINENISAVTTDNPNGMRNGAVFDFENPTLFDLNDCEISEKTLRLESGKVSGICETFVFTADENISNAELRVKANQQWTSTYKISNDRGESFEDLAPGVLHTFTSTGNEIILKIFLKESTSGVSPQFDKANVLYK